MLPAHVSNVSRQVTIRRTTLLASSSTVVHIIINSTVPVHTNAKHYYQYQCRYVPVVHVVRYTVHVYMLSLIHI